MSCFFKAIYDDYMLCKVTLGVLKGASKLNVLLFIILIEWRSHASSGRAHGTYEIGKYEWVSIERK